MLFNRGGKKFGDLREHRGCLEEVPKPGSKEKGHKLSSLNRLDEVVVEGS